MDKKEFKKFDKGAIIKAQEGKMEKIKQWLIELGIEFEEKENEE